MSYWATQFPALHKVKYTFGRHFEIFINIIIQTYSLAFSILLSLYIIIIKQSTNISGANYESNYAHLYRPYVGQSTCGTLIGWQVYMTQHRKLVTLGEDELILMWDTQDMTSRKQIQINNSKQLSFTCIDYSQRDNIFALGTSSGNVLFVDAHNTSNTSLVYKSQCSIINVKFSKAYQYLAIGTSQQKGVIYHKQFNRFYRCDAAHQGVNLYSDLTSDQKVLITLGSDGYCGLYLVQPQSINQLQFKSKYKMFHNEELNNYVNFSERPNKLGHLSFGGATTLQQVFLEYNSQGEMQSNYQIKRQIHEDENIRNVCWVNENILALSMENKVSLWNYVTKNRFHVINETSWLPILTASNLVFGINSRGQIYRYENIKSLTFQNEQAHKYIINEENQKNNENRIIEQKPEQIVEQNIAKEVIEKKIKKKIEVSKAAHLVTKVTQPGLESYYEILMDNQFIFYNQHGCLIKRYEGSEEVIELEFHDKFRIRRMKFESRGKYYCYFALSSACFMYSSLSHFYFEMEIMNKNKRSDSISKDSYVIKWDYKMAGIQGLAIGNAWVAVAGKNQIRVFDFSGNQLHCLCFDRQFMAFAAHEDFLAISYSAAIPLAQSQLLQVKVYSVNSQMLKLEKTIIMPIKAQSNLKWFGFSSEGCLFNQDTSETIRMFIWEKNQWANIYEEDINKYKIFIQHIENYEIYGFRIQQKQGQPSTPTVLPRSLPRKIPFQIAIAKLSFLKPDQNKRLQSIFIGRLSLLHEKFRSKRWYKYKYSRDPTNIMYKSSQKIKSDQEIQQMMTQSDIYVVEQISKVLPTLNEKLKGDELQKGKFEILTICHHILFHTSSLSKIMSILSTDNMVEKYVDPIRLTSGDERSKYRGLKRLQSLIDRGWIDREISNE